MRREMDELFGDVFSATALTPIRQAGFTSSVDVYYTVDPPQVVVVAELAGIERDLLELKIEGRTLIFSGVRRPAQAEGRDYQQIEIGHGPFRRVVTLAADVCAEDARAVYRDGILRIEVPLRQIGSQAHSVPVEIPDEDDE